MTSVRVPALKLGSHYTFLGAQKVRVDVSAEVFNRAGGGVQWNQVREDPPHRT